MIEVEGASITIGGRTLLARASFRIAAGQKVGLVGRNGAGKSSLMSVLVNDSAPGLSVRGSFTINGSVGFLPQMPPPSGLGIAPSVRSHLLSSRGLDDTELELEESLVSMEKNPTGEAVERYSAAEESWRHFGGYEAESELLRLFAGVGLPATLLRDEVANLSGGERRRVELVRVLFQQSDALILDEPTNHLDADAKLWLMHALSTYPGPLLIVSHDLELLDTSISRILHLENGALTEYRGTYSAYVKNRELDRVRLEKTGKEQDREIKRLAELADSMRHSSAKRARVAKSLDKRVERLEEEHVQLAPVEKTVRYRLPEPPWSGRLALSCENLHKSFGSHTVLDGVGFSVERGKRIVVIGRNGVGKTTLLKMLVGRLSPDEGTVNLGPEVKIGLYAQEHENLDLKKIALENITAPIPVQEKRRLLGMFGVIGDMALQRTKTMSGGERTKLSLAQLVAGGHNLLLLDEPTNNLDPASRVAVAKAIDAWKGTLVVVSHDTEFVEAIHPTFALTMPDGTLHYWGSKLLESVAAL